MKEQDKFLVAIVVSAVLLVAAVVWLMGMARGPTYRGALTPVTVQLKWVHQAQFAGMYVAKERGFYEEVGLDVSLRELRPDDSDVIEKVGQGELEFALVDPLSLLQAIGRGEQLKAIAGIYQISPFAFVTLKGSGISSPLDFKGRVLGNSGNALEAGLMYGLLLERFDIDAESVVTKSLGYDAVQDLIAGNVDVIDAYRTNEVRALDQAGLEYTLIQPERFGLLFGNDILITSVGRIVEEPELVRRFVQATVRGWEYALQRPDMAIDETMLYVIDENYTDRGLQNFILGQSAPLIKPEPGGKIGDMTFSRWSRMYRALQSRGLLEQSFDVSDIFTTSFLP